MPHRNRITQLLLILYAAGSVAVAIPLLFAFTNSGDLADTTSGKVLAAALLAMAFGALLAARDPWGNRVLITVLIAFTAMSALAILYRLGFEDHANARLDGPPLRHRGARALRAVLSPPAGWLTRVARCIRGILVCAAGNEVRCVRYLLIIYTHLQGP